jgi:hypothetical protein
VPNLSAACKTFHVYKKIDFPRFYCYFDANLFNQ